MSLTVERITDPETIREEWRTLCDLCEDKDAYLQPFFLLTWGRMAANIWTPDMIAVREGERLIGLLPVYVRSVVGCRIIGFPVSGSTPPLDLIVEDGREAEVAAAITQHLSHRNDWDLLWLHKLDLSRAPAAALAEALQNLDTPRLRDVGATYLITLGGQNSDEYFAGLPRKFRKEVERMGRRHGDLGETQDLHCPEMIELPQAMDMISAVLVNSWKGESEASNAQTLERLHDLSKAALEDGKLRITIKTVAGRPSSYLLSFIYAGRVFPFHIAYDLELRQIGPGQVLLRSEIARAFDEGMDEIDLGGGFSYLGKWANAERRYSEISLIRPALRSRVIATAYLKRKDARHAAARAQVEALKERKIKEATAAKGQKE